MHGLLVIDKPAGLTSHDVVARVRRLTGWKTVGHTGTLDPMATGVLPLLVGRATRLARFLSASDKVYEAEVRLGWATDTYDATGRPITITGLKPCAAIAANRPGPTSGVATGAVDLRELEPASPARDAEQDFTPASVVAWPARHVVEALLDRFRGTVLQAPPPFSAKKVEGVRAYTLARTGVSVELRRARVTLYDAAILGCESDRLRLRVHCSAGFYVRAFAHDLGLATGPGAHLSALRRTRSGDWDVTAAVALQEIAADPEQARARLIPIDRLLPSCPAVVVTSEGAARTRHGRDLRRCDIAGGELGSAPGPVRVLDADGTLLAIGRLEEGRGVLHPGIVVV